MLRQMLFSTLVFFAAWAGWLPLSGPWTAAAEAAGAEAATEYAVKAHGSRKCRRCRQRRRFCRPSCHRAASCRRTAESAWRPLFDGRTLAGWSESDFFHPGQVRIEEGTLRLEMGQPLTGITWQDEFPTDNYEIRLEAMRVEGNDFFCGLTFPVGQSHCTLVLGGWGGMTTGISSIDSYDASENETTTYVNYEQGRWYAVRLRVAEGRITAWLDNAPEPLVDVEVAQSRLSTRWEVEFSKPLGIASYQTTAALRNLEYRRLPTHARQGETADPNAGR